MTKTQSRRVVESLLEIEDLPHTIETSILEKAQGNPCFLEEIIRSLIDRGVLYRETGRWKAREEADPAIVPEGVRNIIQSRVDALGREPKRVLQNAAVLGQVFSWEVLRRMLGSDISDHAAQVLVDNRYIYVEHERPQREYAFEHVLVQEEIYRMIPARRMRKLHGLAGGSIEELCGQRLREYTEQLAYHFDRSDDGEKAIRYLLAAGDKAYRLYLNDEGTGYMIRNSRFLAALPYSEELATAYQHVITYYFVKEKNLEKVREWIAIYEDKVMRIRDLRARVNVYNLKGARLFAGMGDYIGAIAQYEQAIVLARKVGDRLDEYQSMNFLGNAFEVLGKLEQSCQCAETALAIAEEIGNERAQSWAPACLGQPCLAVGETWQSH